MEVASTVHQYVATLDSPVTVTGDSTNILPSASQISGQGWSVYNGKVEANSLTAPDSSPTADTVTSTVSNTYLLDEVTSPAEYDGATVTASIYLAVPSGTQAVTLAIGNVNSSGQTLIGTATVTVTTSWQRFDVTGTNLNGLTSLFLRLGGNGQINPPTLLYVWGAQMVMGSSQGTVNQTNNGGNSGSTLATNGLNETYGYDSFGNMLSAGNFNFMQSYTTANQLSGWNYDASGNLLTDSFNNVYTYDAESRIATEVPSSGGSYAYVYDADGNRVEKGGTGGTDYIYFGGRQLARLSGGQWTDLIYGVSGLLAEVPGTQAGAPVYRMVDHLGSVVGTINSSGTLLSTLDYAPFGQIFAGGTADPYVFTGKERDAESGNDYFGARYYASSMGRWMSPDWSAKVMPVPYAKLDNPQSLNLYAYVGNNPLSRFDPDGHYICNGSKDQCGEIQTALNLAKAAVKDLGADSKEGKAIQKVVDLYGDAGTKNGVNVSFETMKPGQLGSAGVGKDGSINVKFDLKQINALGDHSLQGGASRFGERVATVVHEGTHGVDERRWGHNPSTPQQEDWTEHNAYRNGSFAVTGLGWTSANGRFYPGMSDNDREAAVDENSKLSDAIWAGKP